MNVLLNVDYNRYLLSIEDAAKVMKILGSARSVSYRYGGEDQDPFFEYNAKDPHLEIAPLQTEVREPVREDA